MTAVAPIHFPPTVHGARKELPDVLTIQCVGPVEPRSRNRDRDGKTPMGYERRTVCRETDETDASLWQRVMLIVKHFKDRYGYAQDVCVQCDYDSTVEQGKHDRAKDEWINLRAALAYASAHDRSPRVRAIAAIALVQLNGFLRTGR